MDPTESTQTSLSRTLLPGLLAGLIVWVALDWLSVFFADSAERMFFPLVALIILSAFLLPGLVAGIVSQIVLTRRSWAPRLTWFLLALLYLLARAGAILAVNLLPPPYLREVDQRGVALLLALLGSGFWLVFARAALASILRQPRETAGSVGRHWLLVTGQAVLAVFIAASWLPGTGTLLMGGTIGVPAMTFLAVYGTSRRVPEDRSPAFLITLWALPAVTVVSAFTVIALGF